MNIFFLSWNPRICARLYCDQHVVKIVLEIVQMLYTAHWILSEEGWNDNAPLTKSGIKGYKKAHPNHPMTLWVRSSRNNYIWASELAMELIIEHNRRFGGCHSCAPHALWLNDRIPTIFQNERNPKSVYTVNGHPERLTPIPLCMPNEYHDINSPINSYHSYYKGAKLEFARWKPNAIASKMILMNDKIPLKFIGT